MQAEGVLELLSKVDLLNAAGRQLADTALMGGVLSPLFQAVKGFMPKNAKKWHVRLALLVLAAGGVAGYASFNNLELLDPLNLFWVAWIYGVASLSYKHTAKDSMDKRNSA